ncbi:SDR family NAD(P)-dependent oxidoreductase [Sphingomonas montanisoli]|uniref:SDR family NAD(P)-dependent oxidoreductase n=1 Tax=Sphingomonas montanisoli TaxID=2606412 RepID=A0A5D9C475_9SPHN|nr:SDR family NAD(P)-dependent oxidoreductase [Sphingomonas montanisoli]
MEQKLTGKVALVTGASRGIGQAIATLFASAGATVVVSARSLGTPTAGARHGEAVALPGTLNETVAIIEANGGKAYAIAADLEDDAQCAELPGKAAERAGGLDILVNNAGFADYAPMESMSMDTFDRTIQHYFRAPFILSQNAIPLMKQRGAGWIVNLGSASAQKPVRPYGSGDVTSGLGVYGAIKAGLARLTQGMAAEQQANNIAVNLVAPTGAIRTPGASGYIPSAFPGEPVEYLAAVALHLSSVPAAEQTGLVTFALQYAKHAGLQVTTLDGKSALPPAPEPLWAHPDVIASGL